ncbi:MAG TPA: sugar phosphate isomerase/epimerase family protein [Phycisphaerae bacterium]|nr:sugar phosphate isomerase/epimerase [Phycisphaerae bacterium]HOJ53456.1 sugar phosphate isomerase/epimerase family protein [Phycisphaerae bacterium]HOL25420.1 sugar phosphate isomerase/epimerase family protein [Phycisphaerae bacterium]HPP19903.1 sugar phosphate isomerase/epimerase family protein [Phycisphaerae bacterium]HPU31171.1 sugar phosphate isomerase/epimerase family protein [Phycisphaerae bacterium]
MPSEGIFKTGINGWTFPSGTPWAEAARAARAAGFEALEPVLDAEGELSLLTDESSCRRLGDQIREAGLEIAGLATGLWWQTPLTSPDRAARQKALELGVAALDRARWLGAPVLLVVPGVVGRWNAREPAVPYEEALSYAFNALRTLSFEAEARNVMIGIENVWSRFLLSPVEMRELIDHVNSAWVRAYLDVGNVLQFGYPQDWIQTLSTRIIRVHAKDYRLESGTPRGFCLPGDGDVDWPQVVAALRQIRYEGPVTYEGQGDLVEIRQRLDRVLSG